MRTAPVSGLDIEIPSAPPAPAAPSRRTAGRVPALVGEPMAGSGAAAALGSSSAALGAEILWSLGVFEVSPALGGAAGAIGGALVGLGAGALHAFARGGRWSVLDQAAAVGLAPFAAALSTYLGSRLLDASDRCHMDDPRSAASGAIGGALLLPLIAVLLALTHVKLGRRGAAAAHKATHAGATPDPGGLTANQGRTVATAGTMTAVEGPARSGAEAV